MERMLGRRVRRIQTREGMKRCENGKSEKPWVKASFAQRSRGDSPADAGWRQFEDEGDKRTLSTAGLARHSSHTMDVAIDPRTV